MKNEKDILLSLSTGMATPNSALQLKELRKQKYIGFAEISEWKGYIEKILGGYGETRNSKEIISDLLAEARNRHDHNAGHFLQKELRSSYPARVDKRFMLGSVDIETGLIFKKNKKYALTISDSDLRCHSIIEYDPGLERASAEMALSLSRQFLMQSRRIFIIDDEKNRELSHEFLNVFNTEFQGMKILDWPNEESEVADRFMERTQLSGRNNITYAAGHDVLSIFEKILKGCFEEETKICHYPLVISLGDSYKLLEASSRPAHLRGAGICVVHVAPNDIGADHAYANIFNRIKVKTNEPSGLPAYSIYQKRELIKFPIDFEPMGRPSPDQCIPNRRTPNY